MESPTDYDGIDGRHSCIVDPPPFSMAGTPISWLEQLKPASACQLFYVLATVLVLGITVMPDTAQNMLLTYGARQSPATDTSAPAADSSSSKQMPTSKSAKPTGPRNSASKAGSGSSFLIKLLNYATSIGKVPHSWFTHFYIVSLLSSAFWGIQYVTDGRILDWAAAHGSHVVRMSELETPPPTMTKDQVLLTWLLMTLQGGRRLYESWYVMRASSSRMWCVHWALGLAFYTCTGVAVWAEGTSAILQASSRAPDFEMLPFRTIIGTSSFFIAWTWQNKCHRHLASLKKYSLPTEGIFQYIISPHYTCECAIYLSLAIVAAPGNQLVNRTLLCAMMFVAANLGATAGGTKQWYADKFGTDKVQGKWKMIPLLY